jgi:hypothetical protein
MLKKKCQELNKIEAQRSYKKLRTYEDNCIIRCHW